MWLGAGVLDVTGCMSVGRGWVQECWTLQGAGVLTWLGAGVLDVAGCWSVDVAGCMSVGRCRV